MFNPDRPIRSTDDDKLGRASFSENLAQSIMSYKDSESLVIGFYGAWGSGKSSIINMTLERVNQVSDGLQEDEKPILLSFNPWSYSNQNQLISQFFKELSSKLKRKDISESIRTIGERLGKYSKFLTPVKYIPVVGQYAESVEEIMSTVGEAAEGIANNKDADLESLKDELNSLLEKQKAKIIIVIDDIDRLTNTEIREIFQLVKSLGDFSNTIYLLAFDKVVVTNALSKTQEGSGEEYLEKIIQVPFELPMASKNDVEQLLFSKLNDIIKGIPESRWNHVYWGNIYHSGLKFFFKNLRDVNRYCNTLAFNLNVVKDDVNPVDFLAIIGLQVFLPEIYYGIRDNKDIFAGVFGSGSWVSRQKEEAKKTYTYITKNVSEDFRENIDDLLKRMFPKLESIIGNTNYGYDWLSEWRKQNRICSPDLFEIYFQLSIAKNDVSNREIEDIIHSAANIELFEEKVKKIIDQEKIINLLDRLEDFTEKQIPLASVENTIKGLMNLGDLLPEGDKSLIGKNSTRMNFRVCYQLLLRLPNKDQRYRIIKNAINYCTISIYSLADFLYYIGYLQGKYDSDKEEPEEKHLLTESQFTELEKLMCKKLREWTKNGRINDHQHLTTILNYWKKWEKTKAIETYIRKLTKTDKGLLSFISGYLSEGHGQSLGDHVGRLFYRIQVSSISEHIEIDRATQRLRKIRESEAYSNLSQKEQLVVNTYLDTIDGKIKETVI